ncbi:arsenite methyltransferase [Denticeps clupeoides]|uniref:Arsenite methyltransferase n=1 Tax=Denticeps clupeoides TaxID=299321 RepID=A0AAY4D5P6_9TELE|nr:arsenite methyltransferase-like [Denticeps clupeoides]
MASRIHENVQEYYGSRLKSSEDLQTSAACCPLPGTPGLSSAAAAALKLLHPEVCRRYFGCGLSVPEKLEGCKVLDLGSGSGRDCYVLSKLVGSAGHVTGLDMTEELVCASQKLVAHHQEKFGYEKPNVAFVQGYMEKLGEAGLRDDSMDIVVSNCVICLCPNKRVVLTEAYNVLKEGGEMYFSDMYSSRVVPETFKDDPVLWGEGMAGALYWQDFISLAREVGFSSPCLVAACHIKVHNAELQKKTADVKYASGTYRLFKLPKTSLKQRAVVTYRGTVPDCAGRLDFDATHRFQTGVAAEVDPEMADILRYSRFSSDFAIQVMGSSVSDGSAAQGCHLSPFLLADRLGASVKLCSKAGQGFDCSE